MTFVVIEDGVPVTDLPVYVRIFKNADSQPRLLGEIQIPWLPLGAEENDDHHDDGSTHLETEPTSIYFIKLTFDEPGN